MPSPTQLAFLWHMHQPDYRERTATDEGATFAQPWVYLHALKDYADMAAHLERHPAIHAAVNFSSTLLDQLNDYARQFDTGVPRDPLLAWLVRDEQQPLSVQDRKAIGDQCFRIKRETMVRPYAPYAELEARRVAADHGDPGVYETLPESFFADLLTWYHLAWCGESLKRSEPLLRQLMDKGRGFTRDDRLALFQLVKRVVQGVLPRYARLADTGQVELSLTPHGHPLAPLLIDFGVVRQADPGAPLPASPAYPGGTERVQWHIDRARRSFRESFGRDAQGLWPAEAAVSQDFVDLVGRNGFRWIACDELTLRASLGQADTPLPCTAWHWGDPHNPVIFARNNKVSEFLSFEYSRRTPQQAANHLVDNVREVVAQTGSGASAQPVIGIILDGENAWEHYEGNGYDFFEALYTRIATEPGLQTTTPGRCVDALGGPAGATPLPRLAPGTWTGNGFGMWIGDERRNAAWDALVQLKHAFDAAAPEQRAQAEESLGRCESSDWLWWMGFDEPVNAVLAFDEGFQRAIAATYRLLGQSPAPGPRAFSRIGHELHAPVSPLQLAQAIAKTLGMEMTVQVPEGEITWRAEHVATQVDAFLESQQANGWMFAVPSIDVSTTGRPSSFKYAEVKIALEKSNFRFFEGRALLPSRDIEPGLLVVGLDRAGAQALADRFRLPAVLYAGRGEAASLLSFSS